MKRGATLLQICATVLCLFAFATLACSASRKGIKEIRSVTTMFEVLDRIDSVGALSPEKASSLLGTKLEFVPSESTEHLAIFRGHGGLWKAIELRFPKQGNGSSFVLALQPADLLLMSDVTAHYGKEFGLDVPNPSVPPEDRLMSYVYHRKAGTIWFSFRDTHNDNVRSIMFDRM